MSGPEILACGALLLAGVPASMCLINLFAYRAPRDADGMSGTLPAISVLIPARDEAASIDAAIAAVRANVGVEFELIVMDDHSEDETAAIVRRHQADDRRVRLVGAPALPAGWNGKQHACAALAAEARHEVLVFIDADVQLAPDALRRIGGTLAAGPAQLVSGVPHQRTGTWMERLLIPLIHFVLLGYLPLGAMRRLRSIALAAGCGQLFAMRAEAYRAAGGHGAIRSSRHDGIMLPRAFRRAGFRTDLFDATSVASCRMYHGTREVWNGLAKNATEGMASPGGILPWSLLLLGGHVLPLVVLVIGALVGASATTLTAAALALTLGLATRAALAVRFDQPWSGVALHPLGVALLVGVQWFALTRAVTGRPLPWKGR